MRSTVEPLEGNKVKLSVEVDADEFDKAVDAAFRKLSNEVNIRGFRRGKVPRRVLEAHLGGQTVARQQALQDTLPDYYAEAVRTHEVDVIASPEIDITSGGDEGSVAFDAVVEIRPAISIEGYENLQITIPRPVATDEDVDERIERMRAQSAEFEAADRPAADGDQVLVDIVGTQDGEEIEGLVADDYLYEVGSGAVVPEIDEHLRGAKSGDTVEFDAAHPDEDEGPLRFRVLVKEVRGSVKPEVTDEWVSENSDQETVADLRENLHQQLGRARLVGANMALQQRTAEALAELVTDEMPEPLIDSEVSARIQNFAARLRQQNVDLGQYLQMTGTNPEDLVGQHREPAVQAIKVDLALRAIADAQDLQDDEADLEKHFAELARQYGVDAAEIRHNFEHAGQMLAVRSEIRKGKALDWVLERVSVVDEDGNPVDREALEFTADSEPAAASAGEDAEDAPTTTDEPASVLGEDGE